MFKFITLALVLTTCNCQYVVNGGYGGYGGGEQYILVPASQAQAQVNYQPYLQRQAYSIAQAPTVLRAPAPRVIAAPAPRPVVLQAPPRQVIRVADEQSGPPEPYTFGFQSTDEQGNTLSRSETADGSGTVTGSYSYTDAQGLNRIVEYIADAAGYRATVKTNEPGTANANPADVQITAEEPPAAVQQAIAAYSAPRARLN